MASNDTDLHQKYNADYNQAVGRALFLSGGPKGGSVYLSFPASRGHPPHIIASRALFLTPGSLPPLAKLAKLAWSLSHGPL